MLNRTSAILCKVIVFSASVLFLASGAALAQSVQADSYQGTSFTIATARMGALSTDGGKYSGTPPGTWPLPGNSSSPCGAGQWEFRYEVSFTGVLTPLVPVPNLAYIGMNIPACISPTAITCKSLSCSTGQPGVTPSCLGADPTQNYWRFVNPSNQGGYVLAAAKGASYFFTVCSPYQNSADTSVELKGSVCNSGPILGPACPPVTTSTPGSTTETPLGTLTETFNSDGSLLSATLNGVLMGPVNYYLCPQDISQNTTAPLLSACSKIKVAGDQSGAVFQYGDPVGIIVGGGGLGVSIGTVTVTLAVSGASSVPAGAKWNLDGGTWQASGVTVPVTLAGSHKINLKPVTGYTSPAQSITVNPNDNLTPTATYVKQ